MQERGFSENHLVPGINNISTIGSSPMKRGVHHIYNFFPRDNVYQVNGAGQVSTKINNRGQLPAMLKESVGPQFVEGRAWMDPNYYQNSIQALSPNILRTSNRIMEMSSKTQDLMQSKRRSIPIVSTTE